MILDADTIKHISRQLDVCTPWLALKREETAKAFTFKSLPDSPRITRPLSEFPVTVTRYGFSNRDVELLRDDPAAEQLVAEFMETMYSEMRIAWENQYRLAWWLAYTEVVLADLAAALK